VSSKMLSKKKHCLTQKMSKSDYHASEKGKTGEVKSIHALPSQQKERVSQSGNGTLDKTASY